MQNSVKLLLNEAVILPIFLDTIASHDLRYGSHLVRIKYQPFLPSITTVRCYRI